MLKIHQVSKIYQRKYLLEDLNLEVANGEIFGVIGAHGAGKTTLCRMVPIYSFFSSWLRVDFSERSFSIITISTMEADRKSVV